MFGASAALVLALLLGISGGVLVVQQGMWVPQPINIKFGAYELNIGIVPHPDCVLYMNCAPLPPGAPSSDTFVVSLITHERVGATSGRNLVRLSIAP